MTLAFKKIWDKELKLNGYPNKFAGTFNISYEELKRFKENYDQGKAEKLIKKLVRVGFEVIGDPYWVNHVGILTVPIHFACKFHIPLVIYGENPIFEYGGPELDRDNYIMNKKWRQQHGGMRGMREEDVVDKDIKLDDIKMLTFPSDKEVEDSRVQAVFYGHFFKWEPEKHTKFVKKFGWKDLKKPQKGSWSKTENIDMKYIDIRERVKYLKYGYGRATDQLNIAIRSNLISRKKALAYALWVMVPPIRALFMNLSIWLLFGIYPLFTLLKIMDIQWALPKDGTLQVNHLLGEVMLLTLTGGFPMVTIFMKCEALLVRQ